MLLLTPTILALINIYLVLSFDMFLIPSKQTLNNCFEIYEVFFVVTLVYAGRDFVHLCNDLQNYRVINLIYCFF